jgi:phospholipid/cholesterol/gamma-HCH transport system ATP-binding protein
MKSLFLMGENIVFIHQGAKWWEGEKAGIRSSGNKELLAFMEASEF